MVTKSGRIQGAKVEFLLKRFKGKPPPTKKKNTPLYLPITPQQAIFLPALFTVARADVAEIQNLNGEDCRVITAGLMPELARVGEGRGISRQDVGRARIRAASHRN